MARPTRDGFYLNERSGGFRWTGRDWVPDDTAVGSANDSLQPMQVILDDYDFRASQISNNIFAPQDTNELNRQIENQIGVRPTNPPSLTSEPVPPLNYPITVHLNTTPAGRRGWLYTDTGEKITQSTLRAKAKDFLSGRTIGAKDASGKAKEVYTIKTRLATKGLLQSYEIDFLLNGKVQRTITPTNTGHSLMFTYEAKQEPVEEIPTPPSDVTVNVQHELPSGISAVVNLGGKTRTITSTAISSIVNNASSINVTPTSNSAYNHLYTLYEDASGKVISKSGDVRFSYGKLEKGKSYKLKISISKAAIPADPPADPQPVNSPRYRYEKYTETEKRTTGEAAPGYTKPVLTLTDGELVKFNIGEGGTDKIEVPFTTSNADWVNVKTKGKFRKNQYNNKLVLTSDFFPAPGFYQVWLQPDSNINGTGEAKAVAVEVISKDFLPGPDITKIDYPEFIYGEDYKGYNIDFGVNWESINTNYIDIYVGKVSDKTRILKGGPPQGSQQFNIAKILKQAGEALEESLDVVYFELYLIPYNEEGDDLTEGKVESIKIAFDKGNILLRRPDVMRNISDAICQQFDSSALAQDNSKYLTHLMHFGDGDNKLIATWCTDYETFSEYKDVVQKVANDEGEYVDQIVRKKVKEEQTLVFKMYEPLPRSVQPNQQIWVSKIQSIPIIEQVTLINEELKDCIELKPDFGQGVCGENIGFQLYDDLVASGSATTTSLLSQFVSGSGLSLKNLDIQYVNVSKETSGSILIDGETSWYWSNFVKYSSAEERINNFMYKIKLLEFYDEKVEQLQSGSFYTGSVRMQKEIESNQTSKQKLIDNLDGFESFLYTSSSVDGLTYPGAGGTSISSSTSDDALSWYGSIISSAQNYDYYNKDYLVNNLPQHVIDNQEGEEFIMFFNMMGHHFDVLWSYTKALAEKKNLEHKYQFGIKDGLLSNMLKSLGWDAKMGAQAQALWQYAFGTTEDGTSVNSMTGKDRQNEIWRRLLNNLPYLMKHKGSSRAVKAALACYGVPSSMLTIMEFGGPRNGDGGASKISFEDRTAAINISGSQSVIVPWKEYTDTSDHPNSVEIRLNSEQKQDQTFISSSGWNVGVNYVVGNQGRIEFQYLSGSTIASQSSELMPFFNDEYTQIVVQHISGAFEIYAKEGFNERIRNAVSMSVSNVPTSSWELDTQLTIGGSTFTGSVDEFRYWTTALSESRIDNHTLMPDAIDGNHHSSSTEDLILRLDFEYPKDRSSSGDTAIKNVSINEGYVVPFVTASNFDSITEYPYHYTTYERTVTANVPSSGFSVGNKFRFETQQGLNEDIEDGLTLSYRERSTKKSYDTSPVDSNRLGLFFSPIKEINMDILKSIGQFELDDYIGNPSDEYQYEYKDLRLLRNYYFERYNLNLYEYIQLVRYIDQSLFEVLESLVPARAIVSSGLLIEPHILERNKVKRTKPQAVDYGSKFQDGVLTLRESLQLAMVPIEQWPADLKLQEQIRLAGLQTQWDALHKLGKPTFSGDFNTFLGTMRNITPTFVSAIDLLDGTITESKLVDKILKQFEALGAQTQIGVDIDSLSNGLAGITADNGYALITRLDGNGRLIKERKQVFLVTEQYTIKIPKLINPNDPSLGYEDEVVTKTRKYIVFAEIGDNGPQVGGNIIAVERVTSNKGKTKGFANLGDKYGNVGFKSPSLQTSLTTLDRKSPVETFCTNPNILKVADTSRGAGEPILEVDVK